jgi:hypothetical protein
MGNGPLGANQPIKPNYSRSNSMNDSIIGHEDAGMYLAKEHLASSESDSIGRREKNKQDFIKAFENYAPSKISSD